MYKAGRGIEKNEDKDKAFELLREAANQGYAEAQTDLGEAYERGQGVTKNTVEAYKWYRKAADQGHTNAQYVLSVMYKQGRGVKKDEDEALKWLQCSAEQGYETALEELRLHQLRANSSRIHMIGVSKEIEDAVNVLNCCIKKDPIDEVGITNIINTAIGLEALTYPGTHGEYIEERINIPALKIKIQKLREGYLIFQKKLRKNIFDNYDLLEQLQYISEHILTQKENPLVDFTITQYSKADRILKAYTIANKMRTFRLSITEAEGQVEELFHALNSKKPSDKRINAAILTLNELLAEIDGKVKEGMKDTSLYTLYSKLRLLKDKRNHKVNEEIHWRLIPTEEEAKKLTEPEMPAKKASDFDVETAALDMETLKAMLTTEPKYSEQIVNTLINKAENEGKSFKLSENQWKRWSGWLNEVVEDYKKTPQYQENIPEEVYEVLRQALKRGVSIKFIVGVLQYSEDQPLQKTYHFIKNQKLSDAATFVAGSRHDSLITPGGTAPRGISRIGGDGSGLKRFVSLCAYIIKFLKLQLYLDRSNLSNRGKKTLLRLLI